MSCAQLRRYKYILILVLIALSALFFNYVFVYAAFNVGNQGGLISVNYVNEIDYTASAINTKLKSVNNLTEIVFDYDNGADYETIKSTPFVWFAGQSHINSYIVSTATETKVYILAESDIVAPTSCANMFEGLSTVQIVTLANFNTIKTTSMNSMFRNCTSLKSIKMIVWDWLLVSLKNHLYG